MCFTINYFYKASISFSLSHQLNMRVSISPAFKRQETEAVLIEMKEKDGLLNSKGGFNRCALPRIQVTIGDKAWDGAQEEKEREKRRMSYKLENNDEEKSDERV